MAAAIPPDDCGDTLEDIVVDSGNIGDSSITMSMDIDKPRADHKACRIDCFPSSFIRQFSDCNDPIAVNPDIPFEPRISGTVQDKTIFYQEGEILSWGKAFEDKKENKKSDKINGYAEEPLNHAFVEMPILCQERKSVNFLTQIRNKFRL